MPDSLSTAEAVFAVLYIGLIIAGIIVYRRWKKAYFNIPEKTVTATLIKRRDYYGDGGKGYPLDERVSYSIGKYEYRLNGKRYTAKLRFTGSVPEEATLYYRKGSFDIRTRRAFLAPDRVRLFAAFYFIIGAALAAFFVTKLLGFDL